jgi:hypothetical protein
MPDPLRSRWTRLTLVAIMLAPLGVGFWLEEAGLIHARFVVLGLCLVASFGLDFLSRGKIPILPAP